MKAAVSTCVKRQVVVQEVPKPVVQPGTLLLKTRCCSICGTDLEYLDGTLEYRKGGELRAGAILGHEFCAEVVEIGKGVEGWAIGDRVTTGGPGAPCMDCYFCRRRLYHMCLGKEHVRGIYSEVSPFAKQFGALAEYFVRPPHALLRLPDSVSDEEGALVEPLSVGVGGVAASEIEPGDTAVVIGAGKIGLGAMMVAKVAGAAPVIMIDVFKHRLDKALEMGADIVLNAREVDVISEVVKITEAGPDVILICVRDGKVLNESIEMVRRGGKIMVVGQVPPTEVNPGLWIPKQLRFEGVLRKTPIIDSLNLIVNKRVDVKPMISEKIPLSEAQRAFDSMWSGKNIVSLVVP
ncbi:MAG: zinc-binding dehydrogenase [Dehalococcoidales bacterium]|nr:zinc-binding dehydrogenase [Dehalococcoidales bacterium]